MSAARLVIKLGGSVLYSDPNWMEKLKRTIELNRGKFISIIVGGGEIVEGVRSLHKLYPQLNHAALHWNCVSLLDATYEIAAQLLPLDGGIPDSNALDLWNQISHQPPPTADQQVMWVKVSAFYSMKLLIDIPMDWHPALDWNTTTDALAVLLALRWNASEVLLLKSCDISPHWSLQEAAQLGIVDSETPRLAKYLPTNAVRMVPFA